MDEQALNELINKINSLTSAEKILHAIGYMPEGIEQRGAGALRCYCPIHKDELLRSLSIDLQKGTFRCSFQGCAGRRGGRYFDLYRLALNLSVEEAVTRLCGLLGIACDTSALQASAKASPPAAGDEEEGIDIADIAAMLEPAVPSKPKAKPAPARPAATLPADPSEAALRQELQALRQELAALKQATAETPAGDAAPAAQLQLREELERLREAVGALQRRAEQAPAETAPTPLDTAALAEQWADKDELRRLVDEVSALKASLTQAVNSGDLTQLEKQLEAVRQLAASSPAAGDLLRMQTELGELKARLERAAEAREVAQLHGQIEAMRALVETMSAREDWQAIKAELSALSERLNTLASVIPQPVHAELSRLQAALAALPTAKDLEALQARLEQRLQQEPEGLTRLKDELADLKAAMQALAGSVDLSAMQAQLKELARMQKGLEGLATQDELRRLEQLIAAVEAQARAAADSPGALDAVRAGLNEFDKKLIAVDAQVSGLRESLALLINTVPQPVSAELAKLREALRDAPSHHDLKALEAKFHRQMEGPAPTDLQQQIADLQNCMQALAGSLDLTEIQAQLKQLARMQQGLEGLAGAEEVRRLQEQLAALQGQMREVPGLAQTVDALRGGLSGLEKQLLGVETQVGGFRESLALLVNAIPQPVSAELAKLREMIAALPTPRDLQALEVKLAQHDGGPTLAALKQAVAELQTGMKALSGSVDLSAMQAQLKELARMQQGLEGLASQRELQALETQLAELRAALAERAADRHVTELDRKLVALQTELNAFKESLALFTNSVPQPVHAELTRMREQLETLPGAGEVEALALAVEELRGSGLADMRQQLADLRATVGALAGSVDLSAMQAQLKELARMQQGLDGLASQRELAALEARLQALQAEQEDHTAERQLLELDKKHVALQAELRSLKESLALFANSVPQPVNQELARVRDALAQTATGRDLEALRGELERLKASLSALAGSADLAAMQAQLKELARLQQATDGLATRQEMQALATELSALKQAWHDQGHGRPADDKTAEQLALILDKLEGMNPAGELSRQMQELSARLRQLEERNEPPPRESPPARPKRSASRARDDEADAALPPPLAGPSQDWDEDAHNRKVIFL